MENSDSNLASFTESQRRVVEEMQRIARFLGTNRLSKNDFDKHHSISGVSTAGYQFGSWNEAVIAAGLVPHDPSDGGRQRISDDALLQEVIRVHRQLGKRPSLRKMASLGRYSPKPYQDRWGSWVQARDAAYERFGEPLGNDSQPSRRIAERSEKE